MSTLPTAEKAFHNAFNITMREEENLSLPQMLILVFEKNKIPIDEESDFNVWLSDIAGVNLKRQNKLSLFSTYNEDDRLIYILSSVKAEVISSRRRIESFFEHYRNQLLLTSSRSLSPDNLLQQPALTMGLVKLIDLPFNHLTSMTDDDHKQLYELLDKGNDSPILIENDNIMGENEVIINPVVNSGHIAYPDMQLVVIQFDGEPHKILRVDTGINIDNEFLLELASQEESFGKRNLNFVEVAQWKAGAAFTHPVSDRMRTFYSTDDQLEHLEEKQAAKANRKPAIQP